MLCRVHDWFGWFNIGGNEREHAEELSEQTARRHDYCDLEDYRALSAALLHAKPNVIFEIGTYRGVTSDFMLEVLPECEVVTIAYVQPRWPFLGKNYNNTELSKKEVGSDVAEERRARLHQLYGDSHKLNAQKLKRQFGAFDFVFIDGDHSREGVMQDTQLARRLIQDTGMICWHDANPREMYRETRQFLEQDLPEHALATADNYIGGIACWSREIEDRLAGDEK